MSRDLLTVPDTIDPEAGFDLLHERRRRLVPVVDADGSPRRDPHPHRRPALHALRAGGRRRRAPPGRRRDGRQRRRRRQGDRPLVEAGVDVLVLDTAHGHQEKMIEAVRRVKALDLPVPLCAGNVVSAGGVRDLVAAGADIVKVGVGPGAMCTTRMMTGVGRPQFSRRPRVRRGGPAARAATCGPTAACATRATSPSPSPRGRRNVMIGSWFAGTHESPGDLHRDADGRAYKESFGMASARAVVEPHDHRRGPRSRPPDGPCSRRASPPAACTSTPPAPAWRTSSTSITAGVRSACTYAGARTLEELHERAVVGVQTASGYAEGRPLHKAGEPPQFGGAWPPSPVTTDPAIFAGRSARRLRILILVGTGIPPPERPLAETEIPLSNGPHDAPRLPRPGASDFSRRSERSRRPQLGRCRSVASWPGSKAATSRSTRAARRRRRAHRSDDSTRHTWSLADVDQSGATPDEAVLDLSTARGTPSGPLDPVAPLELVDLVAAGGAEQHGEGVGRRRRGSARRRSRPALPIR